MKAVQIDRYSKKTEAKVRNISVPEIEAGEILVKVRASAVNPLEILIMTGKIKLIAGYKFPLTLGNECAGIVEKVGAEVKEFAVGDRVYARLPIGKIGALAEYVAISADAVAKMPEGYDFATAAAIPLTGLTAYQAVVEELRAKPKENLFIPGGSGSFGQMAVPIAKSLGLKVIVSGNDRAESSIRAAGADEYIDYKRIDYAAVLKDIDCIIDTLGVGEFEKELSVLKRGGRLVSLRGIPDRDFAERNGIKGIRKFLFSLAGRKFDRMAKAQGKKYSFVFVRSDGEQLKKITRIVEEKRIAPPVDSHHFNIDDINTALQLVKNGNTNGKVVIRF